MLLKFIFIKNKVEKKITDTVHLFRKNRKRKDVNTNMIFLQNIILQYIIFLFYIKYL